MLVKLENKIWHQKVWIIVLYQIAFLMLLVQYRYYLSTFWGYMGFEWQPDFVKIFQSVVLIFAFSLITPNDSSLRAFFLHLMLALYLIPSVTIYSGANKSEFALITICMAFLVVYVVSKLHVRQISVAKLSPMTVAKAIAVASFIMLASYAYLGGFRNFNVDISRVYEYRRDSADAVPGIFAYIWPLFSNILVPLSSVVAFVYRRYLMLIFFLCSAFLLYGFTSHKGVLFYPLFALGAFLLLSNFKRCVIVSLLLVGVLAVGVVDALMLAAYGESNFFGWYSALLIRRVFMIPPLLDYSYIELFSGEWEFYYWSSSRITMGIFPSPSVLHAPNLVGEIYFGSADASANTGFIGSGYAQAGVAGVLLYSCGVGIVVSLLQSFSRRLGRPFVVAVMLGQVSTMITSTDFLSLFLTHGMLFSFLVLSMLRGWQYQFTPSCTAAGYSSAGRSAFGGRDNG